MTEVEQLDERIAQLAELIKTTSETIKSLETALKAVEEERDRFVVQQREAEPKFERVKKGIIYYTVDFDRCRGFVVNGNMEMYCLADKILYYNNNYFHTEKRAQEVANKLNFLLKLERLHDTYCPDYTPNWENNNELKYSVFYDNYSRLYHISMFSVNDYKNNAFFATKEIAQKVRDILNAELKENEENCHE